MLNPTLTIWQHLTGTGTSLYSLVGTNVWSPAAPDGWLNTSKAVIYETITEDYHVTAGDARVRVQFFCYGGTGSDDDYDSADAVYRALYDRLHGVIGARVAAGEIRYARLTDGATGETEPETEWKFARAIYEMQIAAA